MCVRFYLDGFTVLFVAIHGSYADASSMRTYDLLHRPWFVFVFGKPPKVVRNQMTGQAVSHGFTSALFQRTGSCSLDTARALCHLYRNAC